MKNKTKLSKKDKDYYLSLPWTYSIETEKQDGSIYYVIRVNELPGICTDFDSVEKGMEEIKELILCAVEIYREKGEPVPEPVDRKKYKGNILYRTDSNRHYLIAKTAQSMHKSISKTLDALIDKGLESRRAI